MTGFPKYCKNEEKKPDHDRLILTFENHYHLAYDSQRKPGEVRIVENHRDYIDDLGLGPDALDENMDADTFKRRFEGCRGMGSKRFSRQPLGGGLYPFHKYCLGVFVWLRSNPGRRSARLHLEFTLPGAICFIPLSGWLLLRRLPILLRESKRRINR